VSYCDKYVPDMEWSASSLSTWWYIKGVCEKLNACITISDPHSEEKKIIINAQDFLIWSHKILNNKYNNQ